MTAQLRKLVWLLDARERRNALLLLGLMIVGALLEVVGVAAVPAFVGALMDPEGLHTIPGAPAVIDFLGLETTLDYIVWGGLTLAVLFAAKNGILVLNYYAQARYVAGRQRSLGRRLTEAYLRAPYTLHLQRNTAELMRNVNREVSIVANQLIAAALELCTRLLILVAVLVFLFVVEPWATLYWIAFFGLLGAVGVAAVSGRLKRWGQQEQRAGRWLVQALHQGFGGIKEAKVANRTGHFADGIAGAIHDISSLNRNKQFAIKSVAPVIEFAAVAGLLALAAGLVLEGRSTESLVITLSLFVVGLVRLREALTALMAHVASLRYNLVSVDPVYEDLKALEQRESAKPGARDATPDHSRFGRVELRDVWYSYQGGQDFALKGINVTIDSGSVVGFVGSTGAGKSTLVDVVLALLEPQRGGVFVDGVDIRESGVAAWQRNVGYVPQSIYLLDDSIRRNVAFGIADEDIDELALQRAISAAQLEAFVTRQPQGLETRVGERGIRLSGGERQRIGIARALYHDPGMLVFDEATSSLDSNTERAVIAAVDALRGERTIVMIAHRLSTVRDCDMLHFLKNGAIEASDSYSGLEARHHEFRRMTGS